MQRKKSGISEKVQKEVSKRTHAIMATYVQSSPSISAETPNQTPMKGPVPNNSRIPTTKLSQENEPKLSKAQKRKLRMQKGKNRPTRPPMTSNKTVQSGPTRPPLPNRNSIKPSVEKNDEKLSKAQRRKRRKKRMNPPKTNVNGTATTTLSKAQKRKLRMQRKKEWNFGKG